MAATLAVSAGNANGRALARSDGESNFIASFVDLNALHTGPDLVGFACIMGVFVVDEIDFLQVMRPYAQRTPTSGLSVVALQRHQ